MSLLLPFVFATVLTTDPLGYDCVPEERLEAAFAREGKGTRALRTCLPEPCKETFSEATLASYTGYQDAVLYRDYRHRMSSVCGTPTAQEESGITDENLLWAVFDGGSGAIPVSLQPQSDQPRTKPASANRTGTRDERFRPVGGGGFRGIARRSGGAGFSAGTRSLALQDPDEGGLLNGPEFDESPYANPDEAPIPTPLPAPFLLLGAAVAALGLLKRWRGARSASAAAA